jgi:hypothetical protein
VTPARIATGTACQFIVVTISCCSSDDYAVAACTDGGRLGVARAELRLG